MTDPTPEDQFDGIAYGLCPDLHTPAAECYVCDHIAGALRVAVEAEREELAKVRADNSRLRDELAQAWGLTDADTEAARTAEIKRLRAEVERDANTIEQCGLEICDLLDEIARHKQERRDNFDEIRERF
jgi:septal ring factor EnvC (AmiA/AmiB activator)